MKSLERVFAAVQGEPTDKRAVSITTSLYGAKLIGCPLREYYSDSARYVEGQTAVKEKFQPDILFSPFALVREGEAFGSKITFLKDYPPNLKQPAAASGEEAARLPIPDVDSHPNLMYIRESVRELYARFGKETAIGAILISPTDLPALIMGIEGWLETLLFHEDAAVQVLEMTTQYFIRWINTLFSEGAHVAVLPLMFCNPSIITERIIRDIIKPVLHETFTQVKGPIVCHHGGAKLGSFLEHYAALPNVAAFVLDSRDNFSEAREKIGDQRLLLGNIDGPGLARQTPEQIRAKCSEIMTDRKDDPYFILATSNADILFDTPEENILAIRQSVDEFGKES